MKYTDFKELDDGFAEITLTPECDETFEPFQIKVKIADRKNWNPPMLECGHAANAEMNHSHGMEFAKPIYSCAICTNTKGIMVAENQNPYEGRKARCAYYGKSYIKSGNLRCECNVCWSHEDGICHCEKDSSSKLAFFEYKPSEEFDKFYCGCHSWN